METPRRDGSGLLREKKRDAIGSIVQRARLCIDRPGRRGTKGRLAVDPPSTGRGSDWGVASSADAASSAGSTLDPSIITVGLKLEPKADLSCRWRFTVPRYAKWSPWMTRRKTIQALKLVAREKVAAPRPLCVQVAQGDEIACEDVGSAIAGLLALASSSKPPSQASSAPSSKASSRNSSPATVSSARDRLTRSSTPTGPLGSRRVLDRRPNRVRSESDPAALRSSGPVLRAPEDQGAAGEAAEPAARAPQDERDAKPTAEGVAEEDAAQLPRKSQTAPVLLIPEDQGAGVETAGAGRCEVFELSFPAEVTDAMDAAVAETSRSWSSAGSDSQNVARHLTRGAGVEVAEPAACAPRDERDAPPTAEGAAVSAEDAARVPGRRCEVFALSYTADATDAADVTDVVSFCLPTCNEAAADVAADIVGFNEGGADVISFALPTCNEAARDVVADVSTRQRGRLSLPTCNEAGEEVMSIPLPMVSGEDGSKQAVPEALPTASEDGGLGADLADALTVTMAVRAFEEHDLPRKEPPQETLQSWQILASTGDITKVAQVFGEKGRPRQMSSQGNLPWQRQGQPTT